jgi:hypothetical protein
VHARMKAASQNKRPMNVKFKEGTKFALEKSVSRDSIIKVM